MMEYRIRTTKTFDKEIKRLRKRYASIAADYARLLDEIAQNPQLGTDLGWGLRKVRMAIASKGKGKSGGARVITFSVIVSVDATEINLLYIYDKSERSSISQKELEELLVRNGFAG